jgi:CSLREA domain-containing protein
MKKIHVCILCCLNFVLLGCNTAEFYINPSKVYEAPKTYSLPTLTTTSIPELFAVKDQSIVSISPLTTGEAISYSVSPSLPAGLILDAETGLISGTPTTVYEDQSYTMTAANPAGSVNYTIILNSLDGHVVNSFVDSDDANTADGICETVTVGECTLRAALTQIKFNTGRKMILLKAGSYILGSSFLSDAAAADIVVVGMGKNLTSINSANSSTVQILASAGTVSFRDLSIDNFGDGSTGPNYVVYATAYIKFKNVTIKENYSQSGAIVQVNSSGNADLSGVYIYNNISKGRGIIYNYNTGIVNIDMTTWYLNNGEYGGCLEAQNTSTTTINNSTCFGNTTNFAQKAAINIGTCACATIATIKSTLIANNVNLVNGESSGLRLGGNGGNNFNVSFVNNILSNNLDGLSAINDCYIDDNGTFNDQGSNLVSAPSCGGARAGLALAWSIDPMLTDTVPSNNGGNVLTIAMASTSPAIDAGVNGSCSLYDQRGFLRPVDFLSGGAVCDIGPLELQL